MNTLRYVDEIVIPAALALLPDKMNSAPARAMLLAIGLQESRFIYRMQVGGPARGFWQFESVGVLGVLGHRSTTETIESVLETLGYDKRVDTSHAAVAHNDVLACIYARLLLWSSPKPLPTPEDLAGAWRYYVDCWRPGKPHAETWDVFYAQAWDMADAQVRRG